MRNFALLAVLGLLLSGCTQIEHKSDAPAKKNLSLIQNSVNTNKRWAVNVGHGVAKKDLKLLLARDNGKLYTVDHTGVVHAIDEKTGNSLWRLALKAPVSAGPTIAEDRLVVGTNDGKVITVDLTTGTQAWVSNTTSEILSAPRIANGKVFVHTMDGGLNALSLDDGRQLWRFSHTLPTLMLRRASTPAINKDNIIAGFANGKLLSMRMHDGSVDWIHEVGQAKGRNDLQRMIDISADPIVTGDTVYAASYQGNLVALSSETGNVKWEREIPSYSGFSLDAKLLFVAQTNGNLVALDANSGATFWVQEELHGRRLSAPALLGNFIIVGDDDGLVHLVDKSTGKLVGRYELDKAGVEAAPIVNNNIVYILGRSGKLVALEVR